MRAQRSAVTAFDQAVAAQDMMPPSLDPVRVSLIVGGVQKAGTTSLFGYLREHPEMLAPVRKETHFFDNEALDWNKIDTSRYLCFFRSDRARDRLLFDVTPIYLFWPPALERIRRYDQAMKLIFIFRDPIERAFSHWRMETDRRSEDMPFHVAIRQGRRRMQAGVLDQAMRVFSYVERGFYGRQVRRVLNLFPREQILFLRADDLRVHHAKVLDRIAEFLGVAPFPDLLPRNDFPGPDIGHVLRQDDISYLRGIYAPELAEFSSLTGLPVGDWLIQESGSPL